LDRRTPTARPRRRPAARRVWRLRIIGQLAGLPWLVLCAHLDVIAGRCDRAAIVRGGPAVSLRDSGNDKVGAQASSEPAPRQQPCDFGHGGNR
jgi:hypothetical protein